MASIFSRLRTAYKAATRAFSDDAVPAEISSRGWRTVFDFRSGAFQQDDPFTGEEASNTMQSAVVYACIRLLAWDIAKLPVKIMRLVSGIWTEDTHQTLLPLLRKPNYYQGWIDFILSWLFSYLIAGNAYILKVRTAGRGITGLIVLDPCLVQPMIVPRTGQIFYRCGQDPLSPVTEDDTYIPAEDIIHHRYMAFGHPLIGTSILVRAQQAARLRNGTMESGAELANNNAVPPGILIAPEGMTDEDLASIRAKWEAQGKGRIAVVDAAFKFESLQSKFIDSQSKEFADVAAVDICVACGVPPWKVGAGARPVGVDIEALQIVYYQDSLQLPIEHIEQLLDMGLDVEKDVYICLDRQELFLLDSKTRAEVDSILIKGIKAPNEARKGWNLPPVKGGESPYLQQQNFSLAALAARDAAAPAPSTTAPTPGGGDGGQDPESDATQTEARPPARQVPAASPGAPRGIAARANAMATGLTMTDSWDPPPLPWAGTWKADREYPAGVFVTHDGAMWARVWREDKAAEVFGQAGRDVCGAAGEEIGAQPGTAEGSPYWALAVKRGEAPTENV